MNGRPHVDGLQIIEIVEKISYLVLAGLYATALVRAVPGTKYSCQRHEVLSHNEARLAHWVPVGALFFGYTRAICKVGRPHMGGEPAQRGEDVAVFSDGFSRWSRV